MSGLSSHDTAHGHQLASSLPPTPRLGARRTIFSSEPKNTRSVKDINLLTLLPSDHPTHSGHSGTPGPP